MASLPQELLVELGHAGDDLWRRHRDRRGGAFHGFVPADHFGAHDALVDLRGRSDNFLELGSGSGVITIVAGLLGFEAYGIEIEPWLVEASRELAEQFGADVTFVEGSFLPDDFAAGELLDGSFNVTYDGADPAYDELGHDLDDFDLVYAFPWPEEGPLFERLMQEHGRKDGLFLCYAADAGFDAVTIR